MDCSKTENYFKEKLRMTRYGKDTDCLISCSDCGLCGDNNGKAVSCRVLEILYPQKAIEIVQKWSDEHPQKTYLSEFLKHYPKTELGIDGTPVDVCAAALGLCEDCTEMDGNGDVKRTRNITCQECWNTPVEEDN